MWHKPIFEEEIVFFVTVTNTAAANEIHVSSQAELKVSGNIKTKKHLPLICVCAGKTQLSGTLTKVLLDFGGMTLKTNPEFRS